MFEIWRSGLQNDKLTDTCGGRLRQDLFAGQELVPLVTAPGGYSVILRTDCTVYSVQVPFSHTSGLPISFKLPLLLPREATIFPFFDKRRCSILEYCVNIACVARCRARALLCTP